MSSHSLLIFWHLDLITIAKILSRQNRVSAYVGNLQKMTWFKRISRSECSWKMENH